MKLEPKTWDSASLFLMNLVDCCSILSPSKSIDMLQRFFKQLDIGITMFDMTLINIMRDSYLALNSSTSHHRKAIQFAMYCTNAAGKTLIDVENPSLGTMRVRTAVHSGNLHSIVLDASPHRYTIVGPSMAIVKFLEIEGQVGAVHCSAAVVELLQADDKPTTAKRLALNSSSMLITPHKTLTLETLNVCTAYRHEFEKNKNTQTYLVYNRRVTA
jgi:class 3 adenylate cyclase